MNQSALHVACLHRRAAVAKLLIARGATKDEGDAFGRSPGNYAIVDEVDDMSDIAAALAE